MKITNNTSNQLGTVEKAKAENTQELLAGKNKPGTESTRGPRNTGGASVEISDNARMMQKAMQAAKGAPDTRTDRVAQLKKSILDGSYKVDSGKVADKLVDEHVGTDFGKNTL